MKHRHRPTTPPLVSLAASVLAALASTATLAMLALPVPAQAETVNCTNISSLPAVITTQGVYCLKQDLTTAMASGHAILVSTNNVTIDCNGYKLGGLASGPDSQTTGIHAFMRHNVTVRNCNPRGFRIGIHLSSGSGHLVENNRVDSSLLIGISAGGEGTVIRGNRVYDTGPESGTDQPVGIMGSGNSDVLDNIVTGVSTSPGSTSRAIGLWIYQNEMGTVEGNRVRDLVSADKNKQLAIYSSGSGGAIVVGNRLSNWGGVGAECGGDDTALSQNHFVGFTTTMVACANGGGNAVHQR